MIRYLGMALLFFSALAASGLYADRRRARLLELEAWLILTVTLREEISTHLRPLREALSELSLPPLMHSGFLEAVREGQSVRRAWEMSSAKSTLMGDARRAVDGLLATLGRSHRAEELDRLAVHEQRLRSLVETERADGARAVRLCRTLCTSAALALALVLL